MEPKERKDIYEKMLKDFEADTKYVKETGFCHWLARKYTMEDKRWHILAYPELFAQKPSHTLFGGSYWWDIGTESEGRHKRIEALKRALKLVKKLL